MGRAERLFSLVELLRGRSLVTAEQLATALDVSQRTIYRDVQDLRDSGVPIRGEAGVGYALGRDFELPPMRFSAEELHALTLGVRLVHHRSLEPGPHRWSRDGARRAAAQAASCLSLPGRSGHRQRAHRETARPLFLGPQLVVGFVV